MNKLITYISFGNKSNTELTKSLESLNRLNLDKSIKIQVITNNYVSNYKLPHVNSIIVNLINPENNIENSRYYKTRLNKYSSDLNLYLDSDTEVLSKDIEKIFNILEDGYDLVLSYSANQGNDSFWHIGDKEREYTYGVLGYNPLQYQCGVFGYRINEITDRFFNTWFTEWNRYKELDQAAFVRALDLVPVKTYILSKAWNDSKGSIVRHNFGKIRG